MKLKDIGFEEFQNMLLEDTIVTEEGKKLPLLDAAPNAKKIVQQCWERYSEYQVVYGLKLTRAALKAAVENALATEMKGLAVGANDRLGTNQPVKIALLTGNGRGKSITNWSGMDTKDLAQKNVEIKIPALVELKVVPKSREFNGNIYQSLELIGISAYKPIETKEKLLDILVKGKMVYNVKDLENVKPGQLIAIQGKIGVIYASTVSFSDKGLVPVWKNGTVQFALRMLSEDGILPRVYFNARNKAPTTYWVDDLDKLAEDATKDYADDPEEQARFLSGALADTPVIVIGEVSSVRDGDNQWTRLALNITGYSMIGLDEEIEIKSPKQQQTITPDEPDEETEKSMLKKMEEKEYEDTETRKLEQEHTIEETDEVEQKVETIDLSKQKPKKKTTPPTDQITKVDKIEDHIKFICNVIKRAPADLTESDLAKILTKYTTETDKTLVSATLDKLKESEWRPTNLKPKEEQ